VFQRGLVEGLGVVVIGVSAASLISSSVASPIRNSSGAASSDMPNAASSAAR